jgi:translation initiation factor 3 subunit H
LNRLAAAKCSHAEILEEVKLTVHNSILVDALLAELADLARDLQRPRLDLPQATFLEKNLEMLIDYTDDLLTDHSAHQKWLRKKNYQEMQKSKWVQARIEKNAQLAERGEPLLSENPDEQPQFNRKHLNEPSRFDALVLSSQIDQFCQQVDGYAGQSFGKLFLLNGLQSSSESEPFES